MPQPSIFHRRLAGKVAIVTGAGSQGQGVGVGRAIAFSFAAEGAKVCLVDREAERAEETMEMIRAAGGEAFACAADVTSSADCARVVAETVARYGSLQLLVNNVGIATAAQPFEQFEEALWDRVLDVNLKSVFLMCRFAAPHLIASGSSAVVNIASVAGLQGYGSAAYGPSKAGMVQMTRDLAVLYGRHGVRANTVAPGHIFTPMLVGVLGEAQREQRRKVAPLGIEGDAWDIAAATLFLACDESRFITGTCLPVDGGVTEIGPLAAHALLQE